MKRTIAILLLTALLLSGCASGSELEDNPTFYYLRREILYGSDDGVIAGEARELASDLPLADLLSLYMAGPAEEGLILPFPADTRITDVQIAGNTVTLTLSAEMAGLQGMDLSIACACLGYTCFSLTDAETVTIKAPAGKRGIQVLYTVTRDSFLLYDNTTKAADAS